MDGSDRSPEAPLPVPQDPFSVRRRRALFAAFLFLGLYGPYTILQVSAFWYIASPGTFSPGMDLVSIWVNLVALASVTAFTFLNVVSERLNWPVERIFYRSAVAMTAILLSVWLVHIHLAGSQNTLQVYLLPFTVIVVSWFLGWRECVGFFVFAHVGLFTLVALEYFRVLPYGPLILKVGELADVFLAWQFVAGNMVTYLAIAVFVMVALYHFRKRLQEGTQQMLSTNQAMREEIEERRRVETALRKQEELYRLHFENVNEVIYSVDRDGRITTVSPSVEAHLGYRPGDLIGKRVRDLEMLCPASRERALRDLGQVFGGQRIPTGEYAFVARDGTKKFAEVSSTPLWKNGAVASVVSVARDATERKRMEQEILTISEEERQRIGRDLHDGLGQLLTGISFLSKSLEEDLVTRAPRESEKAGRIAQLVARSVEQTRAVARGLCFVDREPGGLMTALKLLASSVRDMFDVSCTFACPVPVRVPDHTSAIHLYRIAQEAVNNALRHGKAKQVDIRLEAEAGGEAIRLVVEDNGGGIPEDAARAEGMGLRIMRYRAGIMGGTLDVRRAEERGTRLVCSVPVT